MESPDELLFIPASPNPNPSKRSILSSGKQRTDSIICPWDTQQDGIDPQNQYSVETESLSESEQAALASQDAKGRKKSFSTKKNLQNQYSVETESLSEPEQAASAPQDAKRIKKSFSTKKTPDQSNTRKPLKEIGNYNTPDQSVKSNKRKQPKDVPNKLDNNSTPLSGRTPELEMTLSPIIKDHDDLIQRMLKNQKMLLERIEKLESKSRNEKKSKKITVRRTTSNYIKNSYKKVAEKHNKHWDFDQSVFADCNHELTQKVKLNALALDKTITQDEFQVGVQTYFHSIKYYSGKKTDTYLCEKKYNQRKVTKRDKRRATLSGCNSLEPDLKAKIQKVLEVEFMSSEEDKSDGEVDHFETRPLRWRSLECDRHFEMLDKTAIRKMSSKARRQTVIRKMGPYSSRPAPQCTEQNSWAIRQK
ncbi:uncharacterized protein [Clytia hemisphaerica]|uniref:uncharacterized protein isoform X2 n=1 Tax=Clytia hemisphaerica TaxID=252671 RepID=UPI0034D5E9DD